jgi:hypothetical protein
MSLATSFSNMISTTCFHLAGAAACTQGVVALTVAVAGAGNLTAAPPLAVESVLEVAPLDKVPVSGSTLILGVNAWLAISKLVPITAMIKISDIPVDQLSSGVVMRFLTDLKMDNTPEFLQKSQSSYAQSRLLYN